MKELLKVVYARYRVERRRRRRRSLRSGDANECMHGCEVNKLEEGRYDGLEGRMNRVELI